MRNGMLLIALCSLGCMHGRTAPEPRDAYWVSSDSSQYSPVARFRVRSNFGPSGMTIAIDSATISVPGEFVPKTPPLMSALYLTAIVAAPDSASLAIVSRGEGRRPERRGWKPIATSDSSLIVRELHYGEQLAVAPFMLSIPAWPKVGDVPLWLVFRVSGNTVLITAPLAPGGDVQRRDYPGGVQVYACGDRDITGRFDAARGRSLRTAYGIAC